MDSIRTTSPSRKQRRTPERQRKIPGSGATSIRALGITLLTVHSKKSLVAEVKSSESDAGSDFESEPERGRWIIDMEPSATVSTTKLQPGEPDEPEEGECLFHSRMWVKGTPLHFIIDSSSQKNLISVEVVKWLALRQCRTHNPTPLDGSAKEAISTSTNSVDCHTTSSPSKTRYCVMLLLSKFVMLFWANLIYGNVMLYMSLGLVVLLLL
jgi:hypothetical protein